MIEALNLAIDRNARQAQLKLHGLIAQCFLENIPLGEEGHWALEGVGPETHVHKTHNKHYRIQNTERRTQNTEHMVIKLTIYTTEYRIQNTEHRTQNTEHRTQNTERYVHKTTL